MAKSLKHVKLQGYNAQELKSCDNIALISGKMYLDVIFWELLKKTFKFPTCVHCLRSYKVCIKIQLKNEKIDLSTILENFPSFFNNTFLNKKFIKIDNNYVYFVQQTSTTNFNMKLSFILVIIIEWFIV